MWSRSRSASGHERSEMGSDSSHQSADSLKGPLGLSFTFHCVLAASLLVSGLLSHRGEVWGGAGGGAVTVGLVGSVPGIAIPRPDVVTQSRVVDETRGLYKSEAKPKPPETEATAIPKFERNKPPRYDTRPSRVLENPTLPPPGAIPYGQGGTPAIPYTSFAMGAGTQGGLGFTGAGGGNFGSRFPWYVEAVQRRISSNWLQSTIDPSIRWAPRVVATFEILRDGSIANVQITQSSGNPSVDTSAARAIRNSSPLNGLPPGYNGSYVSVEFWFDFRR
jgi:protein TonB